MCKKLTTAEFIKNAVKTHGSRYDYSAVSYEGNKIQVKIICKHHGEFLQKPNNHVSLKHGCPKCKAGDNAKRLTKSFISFITLANEKYGDSFTYAEEDFKGFSSKTIIKCSKHGFFEQTPYRHIESKHGCNECAIESNTKLPVHLRKFMKKVRGVIQQSFLRKNFTKKSRVFTLLGCDWESFEKHLNLNPYGYRVGDEGLDLDHIVPISSAKTEEDLINLNHFSNFQLLPRVYNQNIKRNNKYNVDHFEEWLNKTKR